MFSTTARVWARMSSTVVSSATAMVLSARAGAQHEQEVGVATGTGAPGQGGGGGGGGGGGASVSDQVMTNALKYRLQAPLVDSRLESAGCPAMTPARS
jgi:hypothetical protein